MASAIMFVIDCRTRRQGPAWGSRDSRRRVHRVGGRSPTRPGVSSGGGKESTALTIPEVLEAQRSHMHDRRDSRAQY
eukprot:16614-Eustigmatos_ZCMA.PRE.1